MISKTKLLDGRIRLYQDDCKRVLRKLPDNKIALIFTDPPYGHNNNDGDLIAQWEAALGKKVEDTDTDPRPIMNDGIAEATEVFSTLMKQSKRLLAPGGHLACCCGGGGGSGVNLQFGRWSIEIDKHLSFKQAVVWDKGPMGMGWHFRRSYEFVLVATQKGSKEMWYDTTKKVENIIRPGDYGVRKIIPRKHQHPTEKPVELAEHFIKLMTREGDWVLDPFMGSGSTGVAAIKTKRKFVGVELDDFWYDQSVKRLTACADKARRGLPVYEEKYRKPIPAGQPGLWDSLEDGESTTHP